MFILLFIAAAALRSFRFGQVPAGMNQDEAMAAYEAWSLSLYGTDRFGMPFPVYFTAWDFAQMNVLLSYIQIPFIWLFGLSAFSARLPILIFSLIGLYALYAFSRELIGCRFALAVLAFSAVNPWHIMQSRWGLEANMFPHMLMIAVWLLLKGLKRQRYLYISMVCFALSMYAYGIAFFAVPFLLAALGIGLLAIKKVKIKQIVLCLTIFAAAAWPIFGVMVINYFHLPSLRILFFTIPSFPNTVRMDDLLFFSENVFQQLTANRGALFNTVFLQLDPLPWNTIQAYGHLYKWAMPFTAAGVVYGFISAFKKRNVNITIGLIWLAVSVFTGLMVNYVNTNRINIIFYPLLFFTGLGLYQTILFPARIKKEYLEAKIKKERLKITFSGNTPFKWLTPLMACCFALVLAFSCFNFTKDYHIEWCNTISFYFYEDFYCCLDYAKEQKWERLYVTSYTQYENAAHVSEILTLCGMQIDPESYRKDNENRFRFVRFDGIPEPQEDSLYIFNLYESLFFPEDIFDVVYFGRYGAAKPL